jgi:hypothetical protein
MIQKILEFLISIFSSKKVEQKQPVQEPVLIKESPKVSEKPYLITESEILKAVKKEDMPEDHQKNLEELLEKINKVRYAWAKPMRVTSGYRSKDDQIRIYKELNEQRKKAAEKAGKPFVETATPWGSAHLKCAAVDISDPDGSLYQWTRDNEALMEEIGVWMEVKDDQARVHFQIYPPKSGNRWFSP